MRKIHSYSLYLLFLVLLFTGFSLYSQENISSSAAAERGEPNESIDLNFQTQSPTTNPESLGRDESPAELMQEIDGKEPKRRNKGAKKRLHISVGGLFVSLEIMLLGLTVGLLGLFFGWIPILIGAIIGATGIVLFVLSFFGTFDVDLNDKGRLALIVFNYFLMAGLLTMAIAWFVIN